MTTDTNKSKSRWFVYICKNGCVVGKETVTYDPDVNRNIYGHTKVSLIWPSKKELAHSFNLDMYPTTNKDNPASNIDGDRVGFDRLFVESNKAANLLICSVFGIPRSKFDWDNFRIFNEHDLVRSDVDNYQEDGWYDKKAILTSRKYKNVACKGDIICVGDLAFDDDKPTGYWECRYRSSDNKFTILSCFRKLFDRLFNKTRYKIRYSGAGSFNVKLSDLKFIDGWSVEQANR